MRTKRIEYSRTDRVVGQTLSLLILSAVFVSFQNMSPADQAQKKIPQVQNTVIEKSISAPIAPVSIVTTMAASVGPLESSAPTKEASSATNQKAEQGK